MTGAPAGLPTWAWALIAVAVPLSGLLGGILSPIVTRRLSRPVDAATIRQSDAGAEKARADADKARADADTGIADTARGLLATVAEQNRELHTEVRDARTELKEQGVRLDTLETWQRVVMQMMRSHGRWDDRTLAMVRAVHPEHPDPPPLTPDDT